MILVELVCDKWSSCRLMRDSTPIKVGDATVNKTHYRSNEGTNQTNQYGIANIRNILDSPATTSAQLIKLQVGKS